jgi:hypothetical protein
MADTRGPGDSARRTRKTRPGTIDLTATHVEEPAATATEIPDSEAPPAFDPPASEPASDPETYGPRRPEDADATSGGDTIARTPPTDAPVSEREAETVDAEPRAGLGALFLAGLFGALLTLIGLVGLLTAELLPLPAGIDASIANRLAAVEREVAERPTPAPAGSEAVAAADPRVEELFTALEAERQRIQQNAQAIETLRNDLAARPASSAQQEAGAEAQAPAAPVAPVDEEARGQLAELDRRLGEVAQALDAVRVQAQAAVSPDQISALSGEVRSAGEAATALAGRVDAVEQGLQPVARIDGEVKALSEGVGSLTQTTQARTQAAGEAAAIALLDSAASRGAPFADALAQVKTLAPDVQTPALDAGAETGMPAVAVFADRLKQELSAAPSPGPAPDAGLVDRFLLGARDLVSIRPVDGGPQPGAPDGARRAVLERLDAGEYREALERWATLDEPAKTATQASADALRNRLDAEAELQNLRQRALAGATSNEGAQQ